MTDDVGMWRGSGFWFSNQPLIATVRHLLEVNDGRPKTITASYPDDALGETVEVGALLCMLPKF